MNLFTVMKTHKGEIIELIVRSSGYTIKSVAEKMNISRSTLYKHFQAIDVSDDFILRLGKIIHHDFSKEFPHLKTYTHYRDSQEAKTQHLVPISPDFLDLQKRYCQLLEAYSRLLKIAIKVSNTKDTNQNISKLQKEIMSYIEENIH